MRITDIKPYPVWVGNRNLLVVKVETDEGIYGLGESGLSGRELAVVGALKHFREALLGKDPMQRGRIWQELYRGQYFEGGRVLLAAQSAIDIALYDIAGKALGVPVYQLLGGKQREFIPCFATSAGGTGEQMLESIRLLWSHGWRVIRAMPMLPTAPGSPEIWEPRESIPYTAKWMVKVREALGGELTLGVDYHHRLSIAETASFCQRMPSGTAGPASVIGGAAFIDPAIVAIFGGWTGGLVADRLVRSGMDLTKARKICLVGGMLFASIIALAVFVPTAAMALALLSICYASLTFAAASVWSLPADVAPTPHHVASIGGIQNFASNIAGVITTFFTGVLLQITGNFVVALVTAGIIALIGAFSYLFIVGRIEPLPPMEKTGDAAVRAA